MLLIGTLLPKASEEEAGRHGATLGPLGHFIEALGNPGFPQRQPPPERIKSERWCFGGRLGKDSREVGCGVGQTGVGGGQWVRQVRAERAGQGRCQEGAWMGCERSQSMPTLPSQ